MANLAKVFIVGNLTRTPELKYTTGGTAVSELAVAVNRFRKEGDVTHQEVSYFDVVVFGRRAETCAEYLTKGRPVLVEGELVQRRWETQDGGKRSKVEVRAYNVQFLGGREDSEEKPEVKPEAKQQSPPTSSPSTLGDDDIPFI